MRSFRVIVAFALLSLMATTAALCNDRVALVIGNSAYKNISPLRNPRNDAKLMAETLREVGFEVLVALDVDRRTLARAVRTFGASLRGLSNEAVALFYYAGHGVQYRGDNFLIPIGAQIESAADLTVEAIRVADILSQMQEAPNTINLVVLDACRNNPFPQGTRSAERGLARPTAFNGALIAFAAAPGEAALDGDGANSPFTLALTEAIREPGLTVEQVFKRTRIDVLGATGGRQTPWEESSLIGDFHFIEQEPEPDGDGLSGERALEVAFWNATVAMDTIVAYQEYLNTYPQGSFASLAQAQLDALREQLASLTAPLVEEVEAEQPKPETGGLSEEKTLEVEFWNATVALGTIASYEEYITAYPHGTFTPLAQAQLDALREQVASLTAPIPEDAEVGEAHITEPVVPTMRDPYAEALVAHNTGDFATAATLYRAAAETGNTSAMIQLAGLYLEGQGVERDAGEAIQWYSAAADIGDAQATFLIGRIYERGTGVPRDHARAIEWYRRASELGSADAMNNLGVMYSLGEGVQQSDEEALKWFIKGAEADNVNSMFNLAAMYDEGRGAERSAPDAARYMFDALQSGNELVVREMTTNANAWSADFRKELQRLLLSTGVYQGAIDGSFGPGTRAAITAIAGTSDAQ